MQILRGESRSFFMKTDARYDRGLYLFLSVFFFPNDGTSSTQNRREYTIFFCVILVEYLDHGIGSSGSGFTFLQISFLGGVFRHWIEVNHQEKVVRLCHSTRQPFSFCGALSDSYKTAQSGEGSQKKKNDASSTPPR